MLCSTLLLGEIESDRLPGEEKETKDEGRCAALETTCRGFRYVGAEVAVGEKRGDTSAAVRRPTPRSVPPPPVESTGGEKGLLCGRTTVVLRYM